jgi:hypothetical protein
MFSRYHNPYPATLRAHPFMTPRMGFFGLFLILCAILAIVGFFAPSLVEQAIPGWRERFSALVLLGVVLGLIRSIWRLFVPIVGVAFWVVAVLCAFRPEIPAWDRLGSVAASTVSGQGRQLYSARGREAAYRPLPPALPDNAYFAPRSASGSIRRGVTSLVDLARSI